jgi:hypothetical protein
MKLTVRLDCLQWCAQTELHLHFAAPAGTVAAPAVCSTSGHCSGSSDPPGSRIPGGARGLPQLNCLRPPPASPFPCRAPAGHLHHLPSPVHVAGAEPRGRRLHRCRSDARQSGSRRIEEAGDGGGGREDDGDED